MKVVSISAFKPGIFHKILLAMFTASVLPLVSIWYVNYQNSLTHISTAVDRQMSGVSDRLVSHVNDWITMNTRVLRQNGGLREVASMDARTQTPILRSVLREYDWSYLVFTMAPDGKNVARSDDKELIDYSDRVYFRQVMDGAPLGKQVVISKTTGKPSLILSVPIHGVDKLVAGVMAMGMSISDLSERITNIHIGKTGYAFLLDETGKVVAHQKQEFVNNGVDFSAHPAALTSTSDNKKRIVFEEDGRKIIAYAQRTAHGWTMIAQQDYDEAFAAISEANRNALALLLLTLAAAGALAYIMSQRLSRPIKNLTLAAEEISRGKFSVAIPETGRSDEIGALAAAIDRMSVSIRLALDRLKMRA